MDAHSTACWPRATASVTAIVMPRSLNEPVGLSPSTFRCTVQPVRSDSRVAWISGVPPSSSVIGVQSVLDRQPVAVGLDQAGPRLVHGSARVALIRWFPPVEARWSRSCTTSRSASAATVSDSAASVASWVTTTIRAPQR